MTFYVGNCRLLVHSGKMARYKIEVFFRNPVCVRILLVCFLIWFGCFLYLINMARFYGPVQLPLQLYWDRSTIKQIQHSKPKVDTEFFAVLDNPIVNIVINNFSGENMKHERKSSEHTETPQPIYPNTGDSVIRQPPWYGGTLVLSQASDKINTSHDVQATWKVRPKVLPHPLDSKTKDKFVLRKSIKQSRNIRKQISKAKDSRIRSGVGLGPGSQFQFFKTMGPLQSNSLRSKHRKLLRKSGIDTFLSQHQNKSHGNVTSWKRTRSRSNKLKHNVNSLIRSRLVLNKKKNTFRRSSLTNLQWNRSNEISSYNRQAQRF